MGFLNLRKEKKWLEAGCKYHKELDFWYGSDKKLLLLEAIQEKVLSSLHELTHWDTDKLLKMEPLVFLEPIFKNHFKHI